jgi:hypothetical protein
LDEFARIEYLRERVGTHDACNFGVHEVQELCCQVRPIPPGPSRLTEQDRVVIGDYFD